MVFVCGRDGGATAALRTQVERLRLGDTVRFLGHRDDLPEILAAADIFAFPSRYEGLGGVLLEAMALALPIVASDIPAVRETVDEGCNAVLVPPGHPEPLAAALEDLLADPTVVERSGRTAGGASSSTTRWTSSRGAWWGSRVGGLRSSWMTPRAGCQRPAPVATAAAAGSCRPPSQATTPVDTLLAPGNLLPRTSPHVPAWNSIGVPTSLPV